MTATPLNAQTLHELPACVAVPTYDRTALTPSVVHISVGSFHRSHQAMYFDEMAERGLSTDWGLVGVGLHRRAMCEALTAQHGLYTVVERDALGDRARVVGVIRRYLFAPDDREAVVRTLADARTRLVTLTITGVGYDVGATSDEDAEQLGSAIGFLVEALARRRAAGLQPFTVLSCDNLPSNGALSREAVVTRAAMQDPRLAAWIDRNGAFPSSMVDRITPKTMPADEEMVARAFGVRDRWPVMTEPFSQWVVEDKFSDGRPPLDLVGVQYVDDVGAYALIKTRMLNGSHCALGHLGSLAGLRTTDEAMADPVFEAFADRMMGEEVAPLLPPAAGFDLDDYRATLLRRLANPKIGDQLARLCRNGSSKMPVHVLSSIADARAAGRPHPLLTLAVAGWLRYVRGVDERGRTYSLDDPRAERLRMLAVRGGNDPRPLLAERGLFGELGEDPTFADELERALVAVDRLGARAAVAAELAGARLTAA